VLNVIEREDRVEDHEPGFVPECRIRFGTVLQRHRFEPRGRVVAEITDSTSGKPRQLRNERRAEVRHHPAQHIDERLDAFGRNTGPLDDRVAVARAQHDKRILSEERVASDVLSTLHAFEQKRVVGVLGNPEERRHRRQQVGHELPDDGHERASLRELDERVE
jgi:hypothetical protein